MEPPTIRSLDLPSIYTPEGAYAYLMMILAATLAAAVAYLLVFTSASLPA